MSSQFGKIGCNLAPALALFLNSDSTGKHTFAAFRCKFSGRFIDEINFSSNFQGSSHASQATRAFSSIH